MKNIVILTGAGMSAESGICTFRDNGGLWEQYCIEDVATYDAWLKNRKLVLDFYNHRRKQLLDVKPNIAHELLVLLEQKYNVQIVTQNVDDLHERAGSKNVLHLHGELRKAQSTQNATIVVDIEGWELNEGMLASDGSQLRPFIVWFGEAVPMIALAAEFCQKADIFIVIGTSLNVYPAAGLIDYVKKEVPKYIIDPNQVKTHTPNVTYIKQPASIGVKQLVKELLLVDKIFINK